MLFRSDRGDLVWLEFDPTFGHEQAGHRPAIVLSPVAYNARTGLALVAPVTARAKGYPFEVRLPPDLPVRGVVLADQVRSVAWGERGVQRIGRLPPETDVLVRQNGRWLIRHTHTSARRQRPAGGIGF